MFVITAYNLQAKSDLLAQRLGRLHLYFKFLLFTQLLFLNSLSRFTYLKTGSASYCVVHVPR